MLSGNDQSFVPGFSSQCFPVRSLANYRKIDEGGAWLIAYRAEQRQRFKAVLSNSPIAPRPAKENLHDERQLPEPTKKISKKLDGFYLMKKFFVEDPSDLCSINVSGRGLYDVSEDDFLLFDNVVHVDAGDNSLPFNGFRNFVSLRELELPLNNISGQVNISANDFLYLEKLDLSYNKLTSDDIIALGVIPCLKTLHLTGNELKRLPVEMTKTYRTITGVTSTGSIETEDRKIRFGQLENLFLDNNELTDISTFSSLAGLRKLKYLNLENNEIPSIPHLRLLGGKVQRKSDANEVAAKESSHPCSSADQLGYDNDGVKEQNTTIQEDKEGLIMNEVDEMLDMKMPGQENEGVHGGADIKMRHRASTVTEDTTLLEDKFNPPMPFPSLLHLNLANNMVYEEEGLLAVMRWPKLKELVIWGNPLTTAFKGDPPILSFQLGKMKGMRIFRQKPSKRPKPHVNLSTFAGYRKVNDSLPPVPRKRDFLMVESPSKTLPISYVGPHSQPLPPISAPSGELTSTTANTTVSPRVNTAPSKTRSRSRKSRSVPTEAVHQTPPDSRGTGEKDIKTSGETTTNLHTTTSRHHQQADDTDEGFFLTQVDELDVTEIQDASDPPPKTKRHSRRSKHQHPDRPFSVESKYKGFEDLLDVDENDPDITIPKDISGSVRSLQYILQHPLVFTDTKGIYKETPPTKAKPKVKTSRQSNVEAMGQLLDKMRVENKIIESNLENVLENFHKDKKLRKQFPEAKKLLDEVQAKYDEVRMKSLRANVKHRGILQSAVSEDTVSSLESSFLDDDKQILEELSKFKKRIDGRL